MGFGPFSSDSSATDNRIAATDQARVLRGTGNVETEAGGLTLGKGARLTSPGSVMYGDKSGNSSTSYSVAKGGALTINAGLSGDTLTSLLGEVQQANSSQIS